MSHACIVFKAMIHLSNYAVVTKCSFVLLVVQLYEIRI